MKVAICCIVKQENLYLREWVEYYHNMGVRNIILYDNNNVNGEYPQQVIGDYIASGFVIYKDARGKYRFQVDAYNECWGSYNEIYDWIGFLDIDEYWYLSPEYTFDTFFSEARFPDASAVFINWLCYGDCGKIHYEKKPLVDRFPTPTYPLDIFSHGRKINGVQKIFLKKRDGINLSFYDANGVYYESETPAKAYLANGEDYEFGKSIFDVSFIKHYRTLTIEEFLYRRFGRGGYADRDSSFNKESVMECFWSQNEWTEEKQKIIDEFFMNFEIKEDNVQLDV